MGQTRKKTRTGWFYAFGSFGRFCLNRFQTHQRLAHATIVNPIP